MRRKLLSACSSLAIVAALAPVPWALASSAPARPALAVAQAGEEEDRFTCRASAIRVASPILFSEPFVANKPGDPCKTDDDAAAKATIGTLVKSGVLEANTVAASDSAHSDASVNNTTINLGGAVIKAQVLTSEADATCVNGQPALTGKSKVVGLNLNGQQINIGEQSASIPANPLVVVSFNEQTVSPDGTTLTQRALRVRSEALMTDIVIAESIVDVHGNPCPPPPKPECSDGKDNLDPEDELADIKDPGCHTDGNPDNPDSYDPNDPSEVDNPKPQCSDGRDNTDPEDELADEQDPGCHTDGDPNNPTTYDPDDNDETDGPKECSDGVDNDDDKLTDGSDPGCHTDGDPDNPDSYDPNDDDESDK